MKNKINECPYKASINKQCTHKGTKKKVKGKRYCEYEYAHNCELFLKWIDSKEKNDSMGFKTPKKAIRRRT